MKDSKTREKVTRRGFLAGGVVTIAAAAATGTAILMDAKGAWSVELKSLQPEEARTMMIFVRDLFPHDRLPDSFYATAIAPLSDEAGKDPAAKRALLDGITRLNSLARASTGKPYAVADEKARVAVIKQIEGGPFFTKVYGTTVTSLYNQPKLWPLFGYEGPSSAKGGYLHRGFNDLNWL